MNDLCPEGFTLPGYVSIEGDQLGNNTLVASWNSDIGTSGRFHLFSNSVLDNKMSKYPTEEVSWWKYKKIVSGFEQDKYVYRGQGHSWKLRTSFHRSSRSDLFRYSTEDISRLQKYVNSVTDYFFHTDDALEHGALLNLAQHHGFPTPLLDWTWSPYVAAYFAFEGIKESPPKHQKKRKVRVAIFDREVWSQDFIATEHINMPYPCMSFLDLQGIKNNHLLPQQAVTAFTNVDDIEAYISNRQDTNSKQYLRILEIPHSEVEIARKELAMMGITAGSLFPGIEGVCRELKEKYF